MGFDITIVDKHGHIAQGWKTDDPFTPSAGYGGHPNSARPKRRALTVYEGRAAFELAVPMLLYRGATKNTEADRNAVPGQAESVEKDRKALENMATVLGEGENERTSGVTISAVFPLPIPPAIDEPGLEWWVEDLQWGEEKRNGPDYTVDPGHLTWKLVTVTLLEKVDDEVVGSSGKGKPNVSVKRAHGYTVKKGDTLHSIAASQLGDADKWKEVGDLNDIRSSGDLQKKVGKTIKIPYSVQVIGKIPQTAQKTTGSR